MPREKEYIKKLPNGTELQVKICVNVSDYSQEDYISMFSSFAECSVDFYLRELKSAVDTD